MQQPIQDSVSATELARNLSSVIDRVRMTNKPVHITRDSRIIAELVPPKQVGCSLLQFTQLLESLPRLDDDVSVMREDLRTIRNRALLPDSPWQE